jgi:hypothetical protein
MLVLFVISCVHQHNFAQESKPSLYMAEYADSCICLGVYTIMDDEFVL